MISQHIVNTMMLGTMYALVAVGFTLFFGVLDVIKFSHGDVLMAGAFVGSYVPAALHFVHVDSQLVVAVAIFGFAMGAMALVGCLIARVFVVPLRSAPSVNVLLITLMVGTALREGVRLFVPNGSNSRRFASPLPNDAFSWGDAVVRLDAIILFIGGVLLIAGVQLLIGRTKLGLAIKAVAQDAEVARVMGINMRAVVLITFAIGSALAAFAGVMNGLYYGEINYGMGMLLGVVGFSSAIIGGLGNIYGAILGGFIIAGLQTLGAVTFPFASAYRDVFAFSVVIVLMTIFPTGVLMEKKSERV